MIKKKPELLAPAGSFDCLRTAILYGADAVYAGTPDMSLRTKSKFDLEELLAGIDFAHSYGKKIYLTLNLFSHNKDAEKLPYFLDTVAKLNPDGLIIADPGIFAYVRKNMPNLELHISTQANVSSYLTVDFWHKIGASLCVLAREVSFAEIKEIREKCPDIKLEAFVHGSMCMTYSGRCLLSNFMAERGANQGSCAHSCRWKYKVKIRVKDGTEKEIEINDNNADLFDFFLEEEVRPGQFMPFEEDMHGSYILNAKDLCLMPKLDQYIEAGIDSFKIEGRNKTAYYVGSVVRAYRSAIDDYFQDPASWSPNRYMEEMYKIPNRGYTLAFHDGRLTDLAHNYASTKSTAEYEFAGFIKSVDAEGFIFEAKSRLMAGDILEFMPPSGDLILLRIYEFHDALKEGIVNSVVHAGTKPQIRVPFAWFHNEDIAKLREVFVPHTLIRKVHDPIIVDGARVLLDRESFKLETQHPTASENRYKRAKDRLEKLAQDGTIAKEQKVTKTPGSDGCCGRGCNGCLVFWHDESYAKAREKIAKLKSGQLLNKGEA